MSSLLRLLVLVAFVLAVAAGAYFWLANSPECPPELNDVSIVMVPTLDTPIPAGKSVIWCASFQLAWNRLKDDVAKEPLQVEDAQEVANRLNRAPQSEQDLEPGSFYAAAGLARDGIVEKITADMKEKFPDVKVPDFTPGPLLEALAFAYLKAAIQWKFRYEQEKAGLDFTADDGRTAKVQAFGIRAEDDKKLDDLRKQVGVLFHAKAAEDDEYAIDLDAGSASYQVILARVKHLPNLDEILAKLQSRLPLRAGRRLGDHDTLLVPDMRFTLNYHFRELEGKVVKNRVFTPKSFIGAAVQTLDFRLDRAGAAAESKAWVDVAKDGPGHEPVVHHYHFDRPFLLVMKKRDAKYPFLVIWVASADLLRPLGGD